MTAELPAAVRLAGPNLTLTPMHPDDLPELAELLLDERTYQHGFEMVRRPQDLAHAVGLADRLLSDHTERDGRGNGHLGYSIRLGDGTPLGPEGRFVGTSSLSDAHLERESVNISWTLYHPDLWGTGVNAETKWLLMHHAFTAGMGRVRISADEMNTRAVGANRRLGFHQDGVARRELLKVDHSWRNHAVFSILREEWPETSQRLQGLFARA